MSNFKIVVSNPKGNTPGELTKTDVWGQWSPDYQIKISDGMVVARYKETCPVWGDIVQYKSVTVLCPKEQVNEVEYWLEYVHGADCISKVKNLKNGKIAIRSDYQCW